MINFLKIKFIFLLLIFSCDEILDVVDPVDCNDVSGGTAFIDDCGQCVEGDTEYTENYLQDCEGVCDGEALEDNCGTCDSDDSNDCIQDCAGTWGGDAIEDECGICDGGGASFECADGEFACTESECNDDGGIYYLACLTDCPNINFLNDCDYDNDGTPDTCNLTDDCTIIASWAEHGCLDDCTGEDDTEVDMYIEICIECLEANNCNDVFDEGTDTSDDGGDDGGTDTSDDGGDDGGTDTSDDGGDDGGTDNSDCIGECSGGIDEETGFEIILQYDCNCECGGSAVEDCNGDCGGNAVIGNNQGCCTESELDCAGICNGVNINDSNGNCCIEPELDCGNICNGPNPKDCDGGCDGDVDLNCNGECVDNSPLSDSDCDEEFACEQWNCDNANCGEWNPDINTCEPFENGISVVRYYGQTLNPNQPDTEWSYLVYLTNDPSFGSETSQLIQGESDNTESPYIIATPGEYTFSYTAFPTVNGLLGEGINYESNTYTTFVMEPYIDLDGNGEDGQNRCFDIVLGGDDGSVVTIQEVYSTDNPGFAGYSQSCEELSYDGGSNAGCIDDNISNVCPETCGTNGFYSRAYDCYEYFQQNSR